MITRFSKNLSMVTIYADEQEAMRVIGREGKKIKVASIKNPVLGTDLYKFSQFPPVTRDTLFTLYASPQRVIEFDETSCFLDKRLFPNILGPSIDTILMCKNIKKLNLKSIKTAIDIGTGSGFMAKYLLKYAPNLKEIYAVDIDKNAIKCARANLTNNPKSKIVKIVRADGVNYIKNKKFDLIICNPPYIPSIKQKNYTQAFADNNLTTRLLKQAKSSLNPNGIMLLNVSSLSENSLNPVMQNSKLKTEVLASMEVPLKMTFLLNNKKWINYLKKYANLKENLRNGYLYWQTIKIVKLTNK